MKRLVILICLMVIGVISFQFFPKQPTSISVTNARAAPVSSDDPIFMVTLKIENLGDADRLIDVTSPRDISVSIMNPVAIETGIVIPEKATGLMAMDGAHFMLHAKAENFVDGAFLPIVLEFERAGSVPVRVQRSGAIEMDHSAKNGVTADPAPALEIEWEKAPTSNGGSITLAIENFSLERVDEDAPHVPNKGHAHVYLNGLKLGRLYEQTFAFGGLTPGRYVLDVVLNSNDHRPYMDGDQPLRKTLTFEIPR